MQKVRNLRYCQNICKRSIREGIPSVGALTADMRPQRILFTVPNVGTDFDVKETMAMGNESGTWIMYGVDWDDPECLRTVEDAIDYIDEIGFLPLFKNEIPGFSLEERTVPAQLVVRGSRKRSLDVESYHCKKA